VCVEQCKTEATGSSTTLVHHTTLCHTSEQNNLNIHSCENFRCSVEMVINVCTKTIKGVDILKCEEEQSFFPCVT